MFKPYNFRHLKLVSELSALAPGLSEERINLGTYHAPLIKNRGLDLAGTPVGVSIIAPLLERTSLSFWGG